MLIWLIMTFTLSGPSWQKIKQPSEKIQQGTVILLDNSLSMLADDIKPNRITRARYKLIDFLKASPYLSTGLVVYSGSAHSLSPVSDDNQTILSLLPNINPIIMPKFGSDAVQGITKAIQLLEQSRIKNGHIIWVLDDINPAEISPLKTILSKNHLKLSLLVVGTEKGAAIAIPEHGLLKNSKGKIVIARLPKQNIKTLAKALDAQLIYLQNDNSDINKLSSSFSIYNQITEDKKETKDKEIFYWLDNGVSLLLPLLLLTGFAFRRGWLVGSFFIWAFALPPLVMVAPESFADEKKVVEVKFFDMLKSSNQQGYEQWQKGDYANALNRFKSTKWKGSANYRMQQYTAAENLFALDKSPTGRFNEANALAKQGKFAEAQQKYEKAIALKPDFKDAKHNLEIIKKIIKLQQQQKPQNQPGKNPNQKGDGKKKQGEQQENQQGEQNQQPPNSPNGSQDGQPKKPKAAQKKNKQEPEPEQEQEQKKDKNPKNSAMDKASKIKKNNKNLKPDDKKEGTIKKSAKALSEEEQAQKTWLNQIPDDPGFFLKNKFNYQYQQQKHKQTENDKNW